MVRLRSRQEAAQEGSVARDVQDESCGAHVGAGSVVIILELVVDVFRVEVVERDKLDAVVESEDAEVWVGQCEQTRGLDAEVVGLGDVDVVFADSVEFRRVLELERVDKERLRLNFEDDDVLEDGDDFEDDVSDVKALEDEVNKLEKVEVMLRCEDEVGTEIDEK